MSARGAGAGRRGSWPAMVWLGGGSLALLAGCSTLFGAAAPAPSFYTLDPAASGPGSLRLANAVGSSDASGTAGATGAAAAPAARAAAPVLIVALPRAAAGFDTDRIVYVGEEHRLQPYADSQWIDTPPRMLGPLVTEALARSGAFAAVLATPSPANGEWELDTQIVRLQHEVGAARVRFTLRATLVDKPHRRVVLAREFDAVAPTPSATPAGAVAAANLAVADVLRQLTAFCVAGVGASP